MAGMTGPVKKIRYGIKGEQFAQGVGASQTLYPGEVALQSGSGAVTSGFLKNAATPGSADIVVGMLGEPTGGAYMLGQSITAGTVDGELQMEVLTGTFFFQSGTGADELSEATNNKTVYYGGENETGPIACATSASSTRPVLGTQRPQDPGIAGGALPGANYWPVTIRPDLGGT